MPIKNKFDYHEYLFRDKQNIIGECGFKQWLSDDIFRWTCLLRKLEFYINCKNKPIFYLHIFILKRLFESLSKKLGFSIGLNTCGPGLSIAHRGTIVINEGVVIGKNCRIHVCVNIGMFHGTPCIGDNVYIAPGAKIFGEITIGDNVAIGANAVVNKDFPSDVSIAGAPAKIISDTGARGMIPKFRCKISENRGDGFNGSLH